MATITTVTPTVTTESQRPPTPDDDLAGGIDLATVQGWTYLSSFVPTGLALTNYSAGGPTIDIGAGRVARFAPTDGQELISVDAEAGVSLADDIVNHLFFRADDVIEVRDADEPPSADAILFGTVDTADDVVREDVRGRTPIPIGAFNVAREGEPQRQLAALESEDMSTGTTRYTRERVSDTETFQLLRAGVIADSLSATTSLEARVITDGDDTTQYSTTAKRDVGDTDTPLVEVAGPADVKLQLSNTTGTTQNGVSGRWTYRIVTQTPGVTSDWPMHRATVRKTGTVTTTGVPSSPTVDWQFEADDVRSEPAIVNGTVYVGSRDTNFYALDASDGSQLWSFTTGGDIYSSAAVESGSVYFSSYDGNLYSLATSDGSKNWSSTIGAGGSIDPSPAVVDGTVYVGADTGGVHAFNASDGSGVWSVKSSSDFDSSPAVVSGTVYIGSSDNNLYALDATDGSELWSYTAGGDVHTPAVVDGVVYIPSGDSNVYAVDASDGSEVWSNTNPSGINDTPPGVANGAVYVGSDDNNIYAFDDADGTELWSFSTGGNVSGSPTYANGVVYCGSGDSYVYALDPSDGSEIWSYTPGDIVFGTVPAGDALYLGVNTSLNNSVMKLV